MKKIVFDTNVLISAIIGLKGNPRKLFEKVIDGDIKPVISEEIIKEFRKSVKDKKVNKYLKQDPEEFLSLLSNFSEIVKLKSKFDVIEEDPNDNHILECAYDGNAKFIVSGDEHLLKIKKFKGIEILTPRQMLKKLGDKNNTKRNSKKVKSVGY